MYIPVLEASWAASLLTPIAVGWVTPLIMAGSALASYLSNKGQANRQTKIAQEDLAQQANNNALNNSNVVYNQQQNNASNLYKALGEAQNYREQESKRTRQDALLKALIGKNPGLGNLSGVIASPQDRQAQFFENRQKGAMQESTYLPKDLFNERWQGMTQDFGGQDEQSGAQRSSILNSAEANLNNQQGAYQNWLDTQNKYSTANQTSLANQSNALNSSGLEKLGTILGLISGTVGSYKAGQQSEQNNAAFAEYLKKLLAGGQGQT